MTSLMMSSSWSSMAWTIVGVAQSSKQMSMVVLPSRCWWGEHRTVRLRGLPRPFAAYLHRKATFGVSAVGVVCPLELALLLVEGGILGAYELVVARLGVPVVQQDRPEEVQACREASR